MNEVREKLYGVIEKELAKSNGHHKSYEGAIDAYVNHEDGVGIIGYPNYFRHQAGQTEPNWIGLASKDDLAEISWKGQPILELHCYLIGNHRHYRYTAPTVNECWQKLSRDIDRWNQEVDGNFDYDDSVFEYEWGGMKITVFSFGEVDKHDQAN